MAYTVKELAKISGVSVRTLHWYDEIGLLKPFLKGSNQYRYYELQELLRLQQILFFKELGFSLNDIQNILSKKDFDNIEALKVHKKILEEEIGRKNNLIHTIDKTMEHLRGKYNMNNEADFYSGLDEKTKQKYEQFLMKFRGTTTEQAILENEKKPVTEEDKIHISDRSEEIFNGLVFFMNKGYGEESNEVQSLIKQHANLLAEWHEVNKELYLHYADFYSNFEEIRDYFTKNYDSKLSGFIAGAIRWYANKNL